MPSLLYRQYRIQNCVRKRDVQERGEETPRERFVAPDEEVEMSVMEIVTYPNEVLTNPAVPVDEVDSKIARLMDAMAETMYASQGVGLAAPQVGVGRRVLTMDIGDGDSGGHGLVHLANPVLKEGTGELIWEEGCLSFPGLTVQVKRHESVVVVGLDREGKERTLEASGLAAVCLQHEIDHLDGIVFVDRLRGLKKRFALREYNRLIREARATGTALPLS